MSNVALRFGYWALRCFRLCGCLSLVIVTFAVWAFHRGVFPRPKIDNTVTMSAAVNKSQWIHKRELGIHQLVVMGTPYERGLAAGAHTKALLYQEEKELVGRLRAFLPNNLALYAFEVGATLWFSGVEKYFEPWMVEEMAGVAVSAPHAFDYLADGLTRQVAYHGVHEVGQMMVDQTGDDTGCTVVALPRATSWVIGRNFDFEGVRMLDTDKIMKWVFPSDGYAFVSVVWAGMVGAVTGVNEHGVYISLNAAGSADFARQGTPSTLVLLKALQFSKSADEALSLIASEKMFITDIFVVADHAQGKLYRIEKSPKATEVIALHGPSVVTNHLISSRWKADKINVFRRDELTSRARSERGEAMLGAMPARDGSVERVLRMLRDKGEADGAPLHLGNRRAIDPLIATHSVIYDGPSSRLFVSEGPGVSGKLIGFDLAVSFKVRSPRVVDSLPRDPRVSDEAFSSVRAAAREEALVSRLAKEGQCDEAAALLKQAGRKYDASYSFSAALGDVRMCRGDKKGAKEAWKQALARHPAYLREIRGLEQKLESMRKSQ